MKLIGYSRDKQPFEQNLDVASSEESWPFDEKISDLTDELIVEIPSKHQDCHPDIIPSGVEPMKIIKLQGRCYRNFVSGVVPWWVIIAFWLFQGFPSLLVIGLFLAEILAIVPYFFLAGISEVTFLYLIYIKLSLLTPAMVMIILLRGTMTKIDQKK